MYYLQEVSMDDKDDRPKLEEEWDPNWEILTCSYNLTPEDKARFNDPLILERKTWFAGGQLGQRSFYHAFSGYLVGEYKRWYITGQIQEECFYKNMKVCGDDKIYWPNGQLMVHTFLHPDNGTLIWRKEWNEIGQLIDHTVYYPAYRDCITWYENGNPKSHMLWVNEVDVDRAVGCYKLWNSDGSLDDFGMERYNPGYVHEWSAYPLTVRIVMSLLYARHRLRKLVKSKMRKCYLDESIIADLGNIVLMYMFKEENM
jgi:hypothetical protein